MLLSKQWWNYRWNNFQATLQLVAVLSILFWIPSSSQVSRMVHSLFATENSIQLHANVSLEYRYDSISSLFIILWFEFGYFFLWYWIITILTKLFFAWGKKEDCWMRNYIVSYFFRNKSLKKAYRTFLSGQTILTLDEFDPKMKSWGEVLT